jgi:aminocarboxymuconate-semialdehyde decarboxylase
MIIDVHAHAISQSQASEMTRSPWFGLQLQKLGNNEYAHPNLGPIDPLIFDLEARLKSLEQRDVDLQLISQPVSIFTEHKLAGQVEQARRMNEYTAKLVEDGGGRLGGLAALCHSEPTRIPEELRRAVEVHGFKGVGLSTNAGGRFWDEPDFEPMFAALEELGLLVFMHPSRSLFHESLDDYTLTTLLAFPTETTIAAARLIFSGVLERHPGLKLVLAHGGGALPFFRGRINLGYFAPKYEFNAACSANISKPPAEYCKQLYYDSLVADGESLRFLVNAVGADRILFGTDFPFEVGDPEGKLTLPEIDKMPAEDSEKILGGNAESILAGVDV